MIIDFRSDTVTKPTAGMLNAMMTAQVGDDVFGEDPTVNELEQLTAKLFGMEAGLFCPSGSMTNQISIKCHTQPGDEVICDESAHVYQYEGGGIAFNASASVKLLYGDRGRINASQVQAAINADDDHKANTSLVCLENTSNRGGGSCYDFAEIKNIKKVCAENNLSLHLDGARLWNALIAKKETPIQYGAVFDTISVCLSKGLGCPVGSVLIAKKDFIKRARRVRKVFGGGMRQAGYLAAAGIFALKNNIERLREDHDHAKLIGQAIAKAPVTKSVLPIETNIIIFETIQGTPASTVVEQLKTKGILCYATGPDRIRLVVHLDITSEMVEKTIDIFERI